MQAFYENLLQKTFLPYPDGLAGTDIVPPDTVQCTESFHGSLVTYSNTSQGFSGSDFMIFGTFCAASCFASVVHGYGSSLVQVLLGIECIDAVFAFDESCCHVVRKTQGIYSAVTRNEVLFVLRVQATQLFDVDVADTGHLLQMQVLVDVDSTLNGRQLRFHRTDAMFSIVGHDIVGCNEAWHIAAGFFRKERVEVPIIGRSPCATDGFVDIARSTVVSCQYQVPILIDIE